MLQEYVKQKLLPYKYPRIVEFLRELPKTGTGKIDREALSARGPVDGASSTISASPPRFASVDRSADAPGLAG